MRSEAETKRKIKQATFRHLKKRLASALKQVPEHCRYNRLPRTAEGRVIRDLPAICIHDQRAGMICDKSHAKSADYKGCPFFTATKSKENLKADFVEMAKGNRARIAEHMPDVAALMWVLEMDGGVPESEAESAADGEGGADEEDEEPAPVGVTAHRAKAPVFGVTAETVAALIDIKAKRFDMVEDQWLTPTRWWMFWRSKVWRSRWNPIQWPWYWRHRNDYSGEPGVPPVCNPAVDE